MKGQLHTARYLLFAVVIFISANAYAIEFSDDFSMDSRSDYTVTNTWTSGGDPEFLYDATGERLQVLTGDDVSLRFDHPMPAITDSGVAELDFLPTANYPYGGKIKIYLTQDADNYYEIINTDGYGAGTISKVVGGQVVDSTVFTSEYTQDASYHLKISFSPESLQVDAFGDSLTLTTDSTGLSVGELRVLISQQDAYIDNISLTSNVPNIEPVAEAGENQTVNEGGSVTLNGSGSTDSDGTIASYLWEQTAGPTVSFTPNIAQPNFTAPDVDATATLDFQLKVTDNGGATATDTVTVTVTALAQGISIFSDDFSTDSRSDYTVTNTWTSGGDPQFLYDATGERLQVLTGDDVSMRFDHSMPAATDSGVAELDFLPTTNYPYGAKIIIQLFQDTENYYEIINTDGYGAGTISKVVGGQVVDSTVFTSEYTQNVNYHLKISFAPDSLQIEAFGDSLTLTADSTGLSVGELRVKINQQDAYIDNISLTSGASTPDTDPVANALAGDLEVTGTITGAQHYDSAEGIVFNNADLAADADVIAEAAYEVTLKPGTSIALGATFVARMKDVDGLPNRCEMTYFGDLTHNPGDDDDGDQLTNLQECQLGTDPTVKISDNDNDQLPDWWEVQYAGINLSLLDSRNGDADGDGISNWIEYKLGTDPTIENEYSAGLHYQYDKVGRIVKIMRIPSK